MTWDGKERRGNEPPDRRLAEEDRRQIKEIQDKVQGTHDAVLTVSLNFGNFAEQFKSYAIAEEKRFKDHTDNDEKHFNRLYSMVGKLKWYVAMGVGGISALEIYIKFFKG